MRENRGSSGSVNISGHFNRWEVPGWNLGNLRECILTIEAYGIRCTANFSGASLNVSGGGRIGGGFDEAQVVESGLNVFPNPSSDEITLSGIDGEADVQIFDLAKNAIGSRQTIDTSSSVDVSALDQGINVLKIA